MLIILLTFVFLSGSSALTSDEIAAFQARPYIEGNTGLQGEVAVEDKGGFLRITSNGLFNGAQSPNYIIPHNNVYDIPKNPIIASSSSCTPMGTIGIAINGVSIFNQFTQGCCNAGEEELNLFDYCWGHPSPQNQYHYHITPSCLYKLECGQPSGIVGVALDGFPIYGPNDEDGTELFTADLDECHGKFSSDGSYRYHITSDFPFMVGCFKGVPLTNVNCGCTDVVDVCTEFNKPPPRPLYNRKTGKKIKTLSDLLDLKTNGSFQCCSDPDNCDYTYNVNSAVPNS